MSVDMSVGPPKTVTFDMLDIPAMIANISPSPAIKWNDDPDPKNTGHFENSLKRHWISEDGVYAIHIELCSRRISEHDAEPRDEIFLGLDDEHEFDASGIGIHPENLEEYGFLKGKPKKERVLSREKRRRKLAASFMMGTCRGPDSSIFDTIADFLIRVGGLEKKVGEGTPAD